MFFLYIVIFVSKIIVLYIDIYIARIIFVYNEPVNKILFLRNGIYVHFIILESNVYNKDYDFSHNDANNQDYAVQYPRL